MILNSHKTRATLGLIVSVTLLSSIPVFSATNEAPYYPTEEQANSGYMNALHESDLTAEQMLDQMRSVNAAESHLQGMQMSGSAGQVHAAENRLHETESMLTETMSQMSGVSQEDIEAMHDSGMSWGQLSQEVGLKSQGGTRRSGSSAEGSMLNHKQKNRQPGTIGTHSSEAMGGSSPPTTTADMEEHNNLGAGMNSAMASSQQANMASETGAGNMVPQSTGQLNPMPQENNNIGSMNSGQNHLMASNNNSAQHNDTMMEGGVSETEMDAATARNVTSGGVSGHGTNVNSGLSHRSGSMMDGAGGLGNGMPSNHGANSGEGSGGMGGNSSGGMGGSESGMGGSSSGGSSGGMGGGHGGGAGGSEGGGGGMM